ncbi:hypothetical protein NQ314_016177 [Rhamnusium bicolor]|uniref:Uncharacterized protein n=1 Tax=Rhamnusium bicolor TaxID=1586634 RepID=A0AAV8WX06_9CUCU|nr:hypothetical protein NQ314_016177 [Rhamnusium bicolor]
MDCYNDDIKRNIFKAPTTYRNEYKVYCDHKRDFRNFKRETTEPPKKSSRPRQAEDHETFAKWRECIHVPFDLLLLPKPIVNTNPYKPFQKLEPLGDPDKEESIKTRPRIYMTPAVSLDDVPDPEMRKLLIQRMYTTDWRNAEREATANFKKICSSTKQS